MCLYKHDSEYASGPKYSKILKIWQSFRAVNMRALHSALNMQKYGFAGFWIYFTF